MNPYRVEYVQIAGWEADEVGLWIAENEDWLLLRHIPVDYVVDGYILLAKAHIVSRKPGKNRKQTEQVLKLKGVKAVSPPHFQFCDVIGMLQWIEQYYGVVEFADEEESLFLGWVVKSDSVHFWIDFLNPKGVRDVHDDEDKPFNLSEIQVIKFDTDYLHSMKFLWQHKQRLKLQKPSDN